MPEGVDSVATVEMPVEVDYMQEGEIYLYKETFLNDTDEAVVRLIRKREDKDKLILLLKLIHSKKGDFPKATFRIAIDKRNIFKQRFYKLIEY